MSAPLIFASEIDLGDGRVIRAAIEVPADHPAGYAWEHIGENSEIAHMAAVHLMRLVLRGDKDRERHALEEAVEAEMPF